MNNNLNSNINNSFYPATKRNYAQLQNFEYMSKLHENENNINQKFQTPFPNGYETIDGYKNKKFKYN